MKRFLLLLLAMLSSQATSFAQTSVVEGAAKIIQQSQSTGDISTAQQPLREVKLPAGTRIEVEVAYTVNSIDVKPGERISFRVLVPIIVDGITVIEKDALVTARITEAKRGGHWGKAGRLAWSMEDVVAIDNMRIPLAPETVSRAERLWSLDNKPTNNESAVRQGSVKGTSHGAEVATKTIIGAALFPPLAPLALMQGFRRGENAVLREGRRFIVFVSKDTTLEIAPPNKPE